MDYMLEPPEPPPEPRDDETDEAIARLIARAKEDPTELLEQIDADVIVDLFSAIRHGGDPDISRAIHRFADEVAAIIISEKNISDELQRMADDDRDDCDPPDDNDTIGEALAWGGRDYP